MNTQLTEIYAAIEAAAPCAAEWMPFKAAYDSGNETECWRRIYGNMFWVERRVALPENLLELAHYVGRTSKDVEHYNAHGQHHRTDGPACECAIGSRAWYVNGQLHRTDGPAIEWSDGTLSWYLNGVGYTEEEFNVRIAAGV